MASSSEAPDPGGWLGCACDEAGGVGAEIAAAGGWKGAELLEEEEEAEAKRASREMLCDCGCCCICACWWWWWCCEMVSAGS